jgi:4-alpha-glucanotransferase
MKLTPGKKQSDKSLPEDQITGAGGQTTPGKAAEPAKPAKTARKKKPDTSSSPQNDTGAPEETPAAAETPAKKGRKPKAAKESAAGKPEEKLEKQNTPATAPAPKTTSRKTTGSRKKATGDAESTAIPATVKKTATRKTAAEGTAAKKKTTGSGSTSTLSQTVQVTLQLRFHTKFGQSLYVTGDHALLGNDVYEQALPMHYLDNDHWYVQFTAKREELAGKKIRYNYLLQYEDGHYECDWGSDKQLDVDTATAEELFIRDAWNHAGYYENAFYTEPFQQVLLKENETIVPPVQEGPFTHLFKVKAPLLAKGQVLCLLGNAPALGNWQTAAAIPMHRTPGADHWELRLQLSNDDFPLVYKYGVYDITQKTFLAYEGGNNRLLHDNVNGQKQTVVNDGFAILPDNTWKGAGVAIPVFSLRSNNSLGTGEFTDIPLLVDWAKKTGLQLIQILPVNDTTATHTSADSYPYAAISAFALHPLYLNIDQMAAGDAAVLAETAAARQELNAADGVEYEKVMQLKLRLIQQLYSRQAEQTFAEPEYQQFFEQNKHWLLPYAAFCYLRDKYRTPDYSKWPEHASYNEQAVAALQQTTSPAYPEIALHYFIQYHLHKQLKAATAYAHENGIILKGDIAIGIYRYSVDGWQQPGLYHMDMQAGAPPDDFAVKGQNWGFPTYNWEKMRQDGFAWWKQRFAQMRYYFDAFRIDHILGFFRIWSIPVEEVEGIMGHFVPAIPVSVNEFHEKGIWFDYARYTKPFINEQVLWDIFNKEKEYIKYTFLQQDGGDSYSLLPGFTTQQLISRYFEQMEDSAHNRWLRDGLFTLLANVILLEVEGSQGQQFHFRFGMPQTSSFQYLDEHTKQQLNELYINYFFRRQDGFWKEEALQKLPALKRVTNMLICGEDLGLVPHCVPDVMQQLGILSLEIQRMPKDASVEFFNPAGAPYLSVVTPSTHDMSTIRGWWEEDRQKTQRFFNRELQQQGDAPFFCEAWVNKAIVLQHLSSPAMWSIFQLQDLLGMDAGLRRQNPHEERINVPANPRHYWRYRMHLTLEQLLEADAFNEMLYGMVQEAGRKRN